ACSPTRLSTLSLHDALPISYAILRQQKRRYWGGRKRAWGFRYGQDGRLIPFLEEQAIMRQVWRWKEVDRKTWHEIQYLVEKQLRSEEHTSELQSRENLVCRL